MFDRSGAVLASWTASLPLGCRSGGFTIVGPALVTTSRRSRTAARARSVRGTRMRRVRLAGPPKRSSLKLPTLRSWRFRAGTAEREPASRTATGVWRPDGDHQPGPTADVPGPLRRRLRAADRIRLVPRALDGKASGVCIKGVTSSTSGSTVGASGRRSDAEVRAGGLRGLGAFPPVPQARHPDLPGRRGERTGPTYCQYLGGQDGATRWRRRPSSSAKNVSLSSADTSSVRAPARDVRVRAQRWDKRHVGVSAVGPPEIRTSTAASPGEAARMSAS